MQCRVCGYEGRPGDIYCEVDGTALVPAPPGAAPAHGAGVDCACGQGRDDGDGFCATCGRRLAAVDPWRREVILAPSLAGVSDRGLVHPTNQDALALAAGPAPDEALLVVCDGVSSARSAEEAAAAAVAAAVAAGAAARAAGAAPEELLAAAITAAHRAICDVAAAAAATPADVAAGLDDPAATIVAAHVRGAAATIGWVGDSRAYLLAGDDGALLTHDHSWVNQEVDAGRCTLEEALRSPNAHAITHCLGPVELQEEGGAPTPSFVRHTLPAGAWLLLCTDGVWNYAAEPGTLALLAGVDAPADAAARHLVAYARGRGGRDNITAALWRVPEADDAAGAAVAGPDAAGAAVNGTDAAGAVVGAGNAAVDAKAAAAVPAPADEVPAGGTG